MNRRDFLEFMGYSGLSLSLGTGLINCSTRPKKITPTNYNLAKLPFSPLAPSEVDELILADGFRAQILIRWGDPLNDQGLKFGFNNDYLAFFPLSAESDTEGLMWVNHEYVDPLFVSGYKKGVSKRTKEQVETEMKSLGGSIMHVKKEGDLWKVVQNSKYNRRLDAFTKIPLATKERIAGKMEATGTFAGCAGGITPWKTVLSCEENYQDFFGDYIYENGKKKFVEGYIGWNEFYKRPPEHYGWVVEINPFTGAAKKLTSLGRFSHECATVVTAADGRCVVYMGDDKSGECIYKFIASKPGSLEEGELFVANVDKGEWLSLSWEKNEALRKIFASPTQALIRTREASRIVGASLMDRPEDVEVHPFTRAVYVALTNNKYKGNMMGSILKIEEQDANPLSLKFKASTFLAGGESTGFACPDNMIFDKRGNMWMTCDMADEFMHKPPYTAFGNNSLFFIPMSGPNAGKAFRVANAPIGAEFTGPMFSPDYETLFLSVQHPGEGSKDLENPTSHWPDGGKAMPKPSVIAIDGEAMEEILSGN